MGYKVADIHLMGKKPGILWKMLNFLGDWLVFRPIRDHIGALKTKYAVTGGSFISRDVLRFYSALNVPLMQGLGSTEDGPITMHHPGGVNIDTVGRPTLETSIRISDDGEILVSGKGLFSGYYKNPEATQEVLINGWVHTGDAGIVTEDGQIIFLDRVADLRQLKGGHRYAPAFIEGKLKFSPYIEEAVVLGDERKEYTSVMVVIKFSSMSQWAEKHHINYTTFVDLSQKDEIAELIRGSIKRLNKLLPEPTRVRKYILLQKEFDADDAELTRIRKVRRKFIEDRYHELVEAIYQGRTEFRVDAAVKYRDGRTGMISTNLKIRHVDEG